MMGIESGRSRIVLAACAVAVAGTFCYLMLRPKESGAPRKRGGAQEVSVRTREASVEVLRDYVETNGEIECESSVDVFADIGGKVTRNLVALGSLVRRGQAVSEVDPSEPGAQYMRSLVYAPLSGTVVSIPRQVGSKVTTSTAILTIGDISNLRVRARVPEKFVSFLKPGLKADVELQAYPGEVFPAEVSEVSPVVDAASRTKEAVLVFERRDERVNAGMFAKVTLFTAEYGGAVALPQDAVLEKDGEFFAYVVSADGSSAIRRRVAVGNSVDRKVQVLEGILPGERVVVEGLRLLTDGARIIDVEATPAVEAEGRGGGRKGAGRGSKDD